ncbi:ESPR-type extended signal peptide-containing protein [Veillonella tobetsuensis]|uniref:ESPR-type extended signal peptide-containing protein n=1 Tax=Veillonella tobetsuensis TaxID=1110546 RepID=UPI000750783A|nr:ESPR-type extended signal peptide-containing protein [Veillonella tobetsuensis]
MNKIFKVVWSKTKECYVVVSEVAKNNGGKKKVLASVLAGLAMVGVAAQMGTPVQAGAEYKNSAVNIQPDNIPASQKNSVGKNSTVVGYANTTNNEEGTVAYGGYNTATGNSSTALGSSNTATGGSATAIGSNTVASGAASVALGNLSQATNKGAIAIGTRTNYETTNTTTGAGYGLTAGEYSTTVGGWSRATGQHSSAFGYNNKVTGDHSTAVGTGNTIDGTQVAGAVAVGNQNKASGDRAIAIGETNTSKVEDTITMGTSNTASTGGGIAIGKNNLADSTNKGTQTGGGRGNENSQIAIGRDNEATHIDTVAVGREVKSTGTGAVGLGSRINATGDYAVAIGNSSAGGTVEAADYSVAVGFKAKATGSRSIAQGGAATAAAERSIAMGLKSNVTAQKANSTYSYSGTGGAIVGGVNTSTKTIHSTAGTDGANDIYGSGDEIAIGSSASVSDESNAAVVIGKGAKTEGNAHYSVVVGKDSYANASDGVVVGQGSYVKARESIAIGQTANVSGTGNVRSQAIGFGATVSGTTAYDALAIGSGAQVTDVTSGVALGSGSEVSRKTSDTKSIGLNTKYVDGTKVRNRSYEATVTAAGDKWDDGAQLGAVSVGNDNQKRQIINVAAGNQDTDAVNVAQLKNVGVRVGADTNTATIGTNKVAADFLAYNGQLNIKGDNNRVTTVSENDANGKDANVNVKFDYNGLVKAKAGSSVTVNQKTEGGKTVFEIDAAAGGATSTESVVKKAAATNDTNIADISVADNKNTGDVGAKYEVSVSRNAVKDAAREAVTVNNGGTTKADGSYTADSNNPISVTPTKDDTNHNTSYAVTFDGNKAAKQIPLTYKANGNGAKTVTLEKGLDFTNGTNTTAEIGNDGVVKYNLNKDVDLSNTGSLKVGGTTVNNGGITIKAPTTPGTTTTDVKLTNTGLDNGGNTITNVAEGQNNTDAVNVKQLKANRTEVKAGDNVVVTSAADATDNHTIYTVNAVTPAVYTTPDGEKLTKDKDGKFHKVGETAEYTGDIITSFENPKAAAGQTTKDGGMIVNNVGSAIKNQTGATYLDKLKAAADNNSNVKNAVVNVSDLKNTSDALIDKGLRFDANEGGEQTNKLGSKVTVQGTGALSTGKAYADEYNTANIRTNIEQGTDGNTTINVGLAKALKGINSISNGSSSITISDVPAGATTPAVTISGGNLSMGNGTANNKIVNLAPGTDGTDAVNLNQLKGMRTVVTSTDKSVTVTSNENSTTGQVTYDLKVATTGTVSKSTWDLKSGVASATEGTHSGDTTQTIADTKSVTMQAGKNLTVKQTNDGNGNTSVAYSLDKDLTNLDKVVVNGKDGIAGKDGVTIVGPQGATGAPGIPGTNGIDGKVGISGKDGKDAVSIAGKDGVGTIGLTGPQGPAGTNGKSVDISTENGKQTLVKPEANNGNQSQRIVYIPKDANGNPLKDADGNDIKREVATMDDGLKFAGDDGQTNANKVIAKQLNQQVDIIGGATGTLTDNNIGVNNDGGKLKVQLAKDVDLTNAGSLTVGGTKVNNDGITIKAPTPAAGTTPTTTDVKLTNTGLDNGGNKITNVAEGTNNTDAVNVKQLKENRTEVKAGDNVVVTSAADATDNHTIYTVNAVTPAVYTTPDGEKLTKDKDGKFHKVGETAEYTGDIITSFENPKAAAGQTTKDGGMIVNNVGSAIKNQTPTMPAGQTATYLDKLKAAADAGSNVKNAAVNVSDLHNTAEALKASELHIAPTAGGKDADKGGVGVTPSATATAAGAATQAYKYNTNTKQVELTFNDGNGKAVTGPKAVIDLSDLANQITSGYTFSANATANGGTVANDTATPAVATAVENGGTINYAAGKNLTVKQEIDATNKTHTYTYSLDKDLTNLDKVVVNGKDGIAGKDGVTIVGPQGATGAPGIPGTNGIDGKVGISGKDGKDAVSIAGKDGVGTIGLTGPQGPAGTNGKSVDISTENGKQTLVKPEANNGNQSQRIVYIPKDANGNPLKDADGNDIKREVATMDDGLKFAGDDGQTNANKVIAKQLNQQVDIIGGATGTLTDNNIGVNNDGGKLKVQLAKDVDLTNAGSLTVGGTKVNNDGITIKAPTTPGTTTTDVKLTNTGLDNGGNKITNVAEGTNNTDAVNVKQLKQNRTEVKAGDNVVVTSDVDATDNHTVYTVNAVTPAVYTTPDGEKLTKDKDGKFHKVGETAEYTGDIITSFENPKAAAGQTTKDGGMIVNNVGSAIKNQTPTMPAGQTATYLDKLKAAADDNSNVKNAAVNVSDLHNTAEALKASELHIAPTVGGKDADKGGVASGNTNPGAAAQAYKYNATTKQVELTFNDGNGKAVAGPKAVIDFSDLNTGGTTASSWNVKSSANTTDGGAVADNHNANAQNIADGKGVEFQSGKNLVVKQTNDTTNGNATVEFSLSDNITAGKDGANGKDGSVGATGKDGSSVVLNGKDGSIGMTGPKGQDGKDGINGRDGANISMTSAKGEQVLINRDPAHSADTDKAERIVYVPKDASGNPIQDANGKNIVREVATMDDGLKFGGDMGTVNSVKLNKQVDVKGGITDTNKLATGNNIGVTSGIDPTTNNATLNVQLAKDLTGLNSVELGGNTIKTDGDHITITSPDTTPGATPGATKTNKVANLADEKHITQGNYTVGDKTIDTNAADDEVTLTYTDGNGDLVKDPANNPIMTKIKGVANSDLSNITETGKKNITKLGSIVKAGDNVTVTSTSDTKTGQTTYTVNAVIPAVYTKADGTKVVKRPDGTFTTNLDGSAGNDVPASDVIVSFQDAAGNRTGGNSIVNNVGSAIDKPGTATGNTFLTKLDNAATNTPFAAVNVRDLKTTADALKANELHIAPTSGGTDTDKGGVVKTAGSTDMVYKYDAASKTITLTYNDGNGKAVTGPKAVLDFTDLNIPAGGNNFGFKANATANGGTVANDATTPAAATAVENGGTVNFAAGKNLTVKQDIDATNKTQTYTFSLDKDLTNLDKVVVNGKDGIAGKDGVTIVGPQGATGAPGIPGTNGIDGKVGISGKDGKDAVSIAGKDGVGTIGLTGPQGPAGTNGKSVDISTENGKQTLVKPEANNGNQSQRIVYVPKDANGNPLKDADGNDIKREVATMDDGLRFTGNNISKENKQEMNSLVKVQGEGVTENTAGKLEANGQEFKSAAGNIAVEADGRNTLTVKMNKDLNLTKDGSVTMGDTVVNNDGITIKAPTTPGTTTTDVKLTNQGLDNGGNKITNVAAGTANTDAVNVKQLKDNVTTVTSSDSSIKVVDKNDPTSATYDATKGHQYDITVNNQGVVNNAQTPVVYTKEDGTKVYKQPDGTFTTNIDGSGTVVPANQVIASMNSAGNSSTDPTKLQNVGSSIADKTGTTFLDKINTAAGDPNAKYGAVNVTDLKSTSDALIDKGLVFDANNGDPKTNKLGSKVTIAGTGALGTTENFADKYNTDNIRTNIEQDGAGNTTVKIGLNKNLKGLESVSVPGKDGVDGQDGVSITGKDGANGVDGKVSIGKDGKDAVSISGKDGIGHIGLTGPAGKDGKNATADITVKEGQPGLNGTDGITRIVYKDKDGNDHEVATHDDGVKYAGDDAQGTDKTKVISKKLNQTIDIVGGADKTKLTDNNIGVNNDGGKLKVQLANELAGINKISNGGSSITFNSNPGGATNTPAVQISGGDLNMGGNKITNLKKGSDVSDAATVGQLTKVKSSNNSVGITESTDANGAKVYDLSVTGVPGADPRVDKLGEEIGRVGAQGAALAALKPIQYDPLEPTQIMAGYGNYRGNSAVALGVAHYKNESTLIHGGVSWAGGSSHMMANAGVTWKVGNRDSEAAVADRYRKGPISSTYAMQQEMAAMKAQNAGLKGEVSDLKAENEQMKAQIAAMMAKLGL